MVVSSLCNVYIEGISGGQEHSRAHMDMINLGRPSRVMWPWSRRPPTCCHFAETPPPSTKSRSTRPFPSIPQSSTPQSSFRCLRARVRRRHALVPVSRHRAAAPPRRYPVCTSRPPRPAKPPSPPPHHHLWRRRRKKAIRRSSRRRWTRCCSRRRMILRPNWANNVGSCNDFFFVRDLRHFTCEFISFSRIGYLTVMCKMGEWDRSLVSLIKCDSLGGN